ncbi:MAG: hypothetical protein ACJ73D_12490 [Pyrinomonadaceae bacterium]
MWESRTKQDLVIEVWEKLDCDSVGAAEIEAIETAVEAQFGKAAVDSPMVIARLVADEGAELRHSEIMELYIRRSEDHPYDAALRNVLRVDSLSAALRSITDLENIRRKYAADGDKTGLRHIREMAIAAKRELCLRIDHIRTNDLDRHVATEINDWLSHWLQTPQLFADWVEVRQRSKDFVEKFGKIRSAE